jgi:hypothetical protein
MTEFGPRSAYVMSSVDLVFCVVLGTMKINAIDF